MRLSAFPLAAVAVALTVAGAEAACPKRVIVGHGDSLAAIARACGINVEALKAANPGLIGNMPHAGVTIIVPQPPLPTPIRGVGRPSVQPMPSLVPHATGPSMPTVILPPEQPPIPPQHILRGFGNQPGQLPLPPGHGLPQHENPFPIQHN